MSSFRYRDAPLVVPQVIGPDGKPERVDKRPAIMDMRKTKDGDGGLPFKIIGIVTNMLQSPGTEAGKARLVTIRYSHYCDRARWALDFTPLQYTEDSHPPGLHQFAVLPLTGGKWSATPCLVFPDGEVVINSADIMRRLVKDFPEELGSLYPPKLAKKITALEEEMEIEIGAYARQIAYTFVLDRKFLKKAGSWFTRGTSTVEKVLFDRAKPMVAAGMVNIMRCRYSRIPAGVEVIMKYFDKIGRILEKQPYICGDEFTAADLTFATLAYPTVFPPEFEDVMMGINDMPLEYQKIINDFRATKAGQHAMRMYRDHRFPPGTVDKRMVKPNPRRDDYLYPGIAAVFGGFAVFLYFLLRLFLMIFM